MNRTLIMAVLTLSASLLTWPVTAQKPSGTALSAVYLYEDIEGRNLWMSSGNVAGIRTDSLTISEAQLGCGFSKGDIVLSPSGKWTAGASARSITHLERFSMAGSFGFEQQSSHDDCGSMFLRPGLYPIDVLEFTPGNKSLQKYTLTGGVSVELVPGLTAGAEVDFSSANYTKLKDLRYTDYILDLSLRPGIMFRSDNGLQAGVSLRIDRNAETVDPEQVGASSNSYRAFLDKGLHYGLGNIWTNEMLHLDESGINGLPVRCNSYGGAFQIGKAGWLGEVSYLYTDGKIGEKDAMWFRYPQHQISAFVGKYFVVGKTENVAKAEVNFQRLNLREAIMEKKTTGGVTLREIYGYNSIFNRSRMTVSTSWKAVRPGVFNAAASLEYSREDGISSIKYPVLCGETLQRLHMDASARAYMGKWSISVSLNLAKGFLTEINRSEESGLPERETEYYENWKLCSTGLDLIAALGLRYTFVSGIYVETSAGMRILGSMKRFDSSLAIGVAF